MPTSSSTRGYRQFDDLAEEFAQRYRRGARSELHEYRHRLAERADESRERCPALATLELAEEGARGKTSSPPVVAPPLSRIGGDYGICSRLAVAVWESCTKASRSARADRWC